MELSELGGLLRLAQYLSGSGHAESEILALLFLILSSKTYCLSNTGDWGL